MNLFVEISFDFLCPQQDVQQTVHHGAHNVQLVSHLFVHLSDSGPWSVNTQDLVFASPPPANLLSRSSQIKMQFRRFQLSTWGQRSRFVPQISWKLKLAPVLIKSFPAANILIIEKSLKCIFRKISKHLILSLTKLLLSDSIISRVRCWDTAV